jgi:hypothetical protein
MKEAARSGLKSELAQQRSAITLALLVLSLPGLTGQSSTPGRCLLDRPVEPGDDSEMCVNQKMLRRDQETSQGGLSPLRARIGASSGDAR